MFRVFGKKCILFLIFAVVWDTKIHTAHYLQVYLGEVSGETLLMLAASWHYWYTPVNGGCDENSGGQRSGCWGILLRGCLAASPALEADELRWITARSKQAVVAWTLHPCHAFPAHPPFCQFVAVYMGRSGFPIRRRGDKCFWSPPYLGGTFLGWRRNKTSQGFGHHDVTQRLGQKTNAQGLQH